MKAIITKFLPPTATRGGRIKTTTNSLPAVVTPYPYTSENNETVHRAAAIAYAASYGWLDDCDLVTGGLPDGTGFAHVLVARERVAVPVDLEAVLAAIPVGSLEATPVNRFVVSVNGCTREQAEQVLAERLGHDEDYGFNYTLNW